MPAFVASPIWSALFWTAYLLFILEELTIFRRDRRRVAGDRQDGGTLPMLVAAITLALAAAFMLVHWRRAAMRAPLDVIEPAALALMLGGMALRIWSVRTLGVFFRVTVTAQVGHRLVQEGPYRWLRHPSYTGALMTITGIALAMGNWASLVVAPVIAAFGFARRIAVEERSLAGQFGPAFAAYRADRWALLPPVW